MPPDLATTLFTKDPLKLGQYAQDSVYQGKPEYAYVAGDWQEVASVLEYCHAQKTPVTFCGSQTSMTGSSVADQGVALALEKKNRIIDIGEDRQGEGFVITEPGVILGDLKRAVEAEGWFYPPDPTSYNEAQVGATIATNATGEDTYKYGPTRRYVAELELVLADGTRKTVTRKNPVPHSIIKNTAGYFLHGEEIDEIIGSEGTLALISRIKLKLIRLEKKNTYVLLLPFSDLEKCIAAVTLLSKESHRPRALELIGPFAAEIFSQCRSCPQELKAETTFLYLKDEYAEDQDFQKGLSGWFSILEQIYKDVDDLACFDRIFLAKTDEQIKAIHECRHHIPLHVNETYFKYNPQGGGKVGTDWWVPIQHLPQMMRETYQEAQQLKIPFLVFAHIGNGHPHWNFLTETAAQKKLATAFVKRQCEAAVRYGGGVAGEHGIGKIKQFLMGVQHPPEVLLKMRAIKNKWDPLWLLGRGNILAPST